MGRLIGLETEYAIHCPKGIDLGEKDEWYPRLIDQLAQLGPIAPSRSDPTSYFMANGGCVSLETHSADGSQKGLLEGATPECSSPLHVVAYQSAQDEILAETTAQIFEGNVRLIKNSSDASGHVFGQHENYEMEVASGWALLGWRLGLVAILPALLFFKFGSLIWFALIAICSHVDQVLQKLRSAIRSRWNEVRGATSNAPQDVEALEPVERLSPERLSPERSHIERGQLSGNWMRFAVAGTRVLHYPLALSLLINVYLFALLRQRRGMAAFLASRVIWDGGGHVDASNRFWLGVKASNVTSLIGYGNYWSERPVFVVGHWLESMCLDRWYRLESWLRLMRRRQRVQISLGDSTPNQTVEYLRVGTTSLVLDLVESNLSIPLPRLKKPVEGLQRFASDWLLLHRAPDRHRAMWNAVELQREYVQAVRIFLQQSWSVPAEAWQVLHLWQATVDHLGQSRFEQESRHWLLGRVDWISKKWLLDQIPSDAGWVARKKVDLRYHELSQEGYQRRLCETLHLANMVSEPQTEKARRNPPENSPATRRSYFIREFAMTDDSLRVDWNCAEIGEGKNRKIVALRKPK